MKEYTSIRSNADQDQEAFQPRSAGHQARPDGSASQDPGLKACSPAAPCSAIPTEPRLGLPTPPLAGSKAGGARSRYWSA
jgi:hypothetical protein